MIVKLRGGIRQLNCQFLSFRAWNNVSLFPDFFFQTKTSDDSIDDDNWTQEDKPRSNGGEGDAVCRNEDALKQIQIACAYAPHIIPSFVHSLPLRTDRQTANLLLIHTKGSVTRSANINTSCLGLYYHF